MIRKSYLFWGGILILLGVLFLIDGLGILNINLWRIFWPLLLILLGSWVLMGYFIREQPIEKEKVDISLERARTAKIRLNHGAGQLKIDSGAKPTDLISGSFGGGLKYSTKWKEDQIDVTMRVGDTGFPLIVFPRFWGSQSNLDWDVHLTNEIPLDLEFNTGASDAIFDLTDLQIVNLYLNTGVSSTDIILSDCVPDSKVTIKAGVASIKINVPDDVAARIRISGGLLDSKVDRSRFPKSGGYYQSPDYEVNTKRVEIKVDLGLGSVLIR